MKFSILALAAAAAVTGAAPVLAHPVTYVGTLSNALEPATAAGSKGVGAATVIFDDDAFTMSVHVSFSDLTGNTTASHIHCCTGTALAGNAGVATPVPTFPGFPLGVKAGTYDQSFDLTQASSWNPAYINANGGTISSAFAAFSTGLAAGKAYINVHSSTSAGGEIRSFLVAAPVPEPETYALMLAGLGLVGWAARRRQQA